MNDLNEGMKKTFERSVSGKKVNLDRFYEQAKTLNEEIMSFCPEIKMAHNQFKMRAVGQFKLFLLGFSENMLKSPSFKFSR